MLSLTELGPLTPFVKEALHHTIRVGKFFCCLHVTNTYLCTTAYLVGPSMSPTFSHGDFVLADRVTAHLGKIRSGDVVLLRSLDNPRKIVTKRVKGVEGDVVSYSVGSDERKTIDVPKGHVWVEGDNADNSTDSREFGPVPYGLLHARIFLKVWPPKDFGLVDNKAP